MRDPIWSSIDGQTWQLVIAEPFRCNIVLIDTEIRCYRPSVVNMETNESVSSDFFALENAKEWCVRTSKELARDYIQNVFGVDA